MNGPASILVCRLSALGDVVLSLPVVDALREAHPDARIAFLSREPHGRVLTDVGALSEVHLWKGPGHDLPGDVSATRWDLVVDLSATGRSRRLLGTLRAGRVLRAKKQSLRRFAFVKLRPLGGRHVPIARAVDRMFSALEPLGLSRDERRPRLPAPSPSPDGPVLLAPGGGRDAKRWPAARFGELARRLVDGGRRVLVLGTEAERELLERVARAAPAHGTEICRGPDPSSLPALVAGCSIAVTNDSGILHTAEAVGVNVVAIFGPTHPRLGFRPLAPDSRALHSGIECSPCDLHGPARCPKGHHRCMTELSVDEVLDAIHARLVREGARC